MNKNSQAAASILSIVLSFFASSHHWLHMLILFFLGSSANMMSSMAQLIWLRRFMLVVTIATVIFSVFRLMKHRHMGKPLFILSVLSAVISLGLVIYTLTQFGW